MKTIRTRFLSIAVVLSLLSGICLISVEAATSDELFQNAFVVETGERNVEKAIEMYKDLANQEKYDPVLVSKAEYRMGICYEKLGQTTEAIASYERVGQSQPDVAEDAKSHLSRLKELKTREEEFAKREEEQRKRAELEAADLDARRFKKGTQTLAVTGGVTLPLTNVVQGTPGFSYVYPDLSGNEQSGSVQGQVKGTMGRSGPSFSLDYSYHLSPHLALGINLNHSHYLSNSSAGDVQYSGIDSNPEVGSFFIDQTANVTVQGESWVGLGTLRYVFMPTGSFHPFLDVGAGLHRTRFDVSTVVREREDAASDTSFRDHTYSRASARKNLAVMGGLGADYFFTKRCFLGLEGQWFYLNKAIDRQNFQSFFWQPGGYASESISTFNVQARIGYKFN